jgi:peptide chain release factor 3
MISRLQAEYKVDAGFEPSPWDTARWITSDDPKALDSFISEYRGAMASDRDDAPVFMAKDSWELNYVSGRFSGIRFHATKERR